ncbi:PAS domain-containing sensor histidine kinase [Desulfopila aestuarii]|uniref:histidine kinase n=1 Tax=Desulfopila aestuarii DSM 18488 TaxID=1121416 RepID=A0A1M7XZL3_9BACT|nr:PAS domain-containing sensor histidine kinase [Desulfopila aestuarii]SHO44652.1 Signal transduction histidine kinase [Desulfopila aestuarii DSM 18488]
MGDTGNVHPGAAASDREMISAELVSRILDSLDGIVCVSDIHTNEILFANSYLKRIFGFDPTGRSCRELIHRCHGDGGSFCDNSRLIDKDGKPGGVLYREYQNHFNKKWYAAKAQVLEWTPGRYVRLEIALDITEQKRLQSFVKEARQQAENAMTTKNRFVALVAHDLKSPFVSILGMLKRILRKESFQYEVHRRFLENIINNGQRMLKMIDNLLDMDRLQTGKIKPEPCFFDLSEMVGEVFENFAHLAEVKELHLTNKIPAATEIFADRYLYFVVLNNLISNAVKFSFISGKIEVSCEADDTRVRLIVKDEGRGIPEKYLKDIFRPDVKTTSKGTSGETGSGLGLLFCQQIMKAHGGTITMESIEGKGATFYVELCSSCRLPGPDFWPPCVCTPVDK